MQVSETPRRMGSEESKAQVNHNGDSHIEIVNNQLEHTTTLNSITTWLWFISAGVTIQLVLSLWGEIQRRMTRQVIKKANKLSKLSELTIEK